NVQIQNSKNNPCAIRPGRRPRGPALRELVDDYRRRAGILPAEQAQVDGGGVDPVGGGPVAGFSPASVRGPLEAGAVPDNNPSMNELDNRCPSCPRPRDLPPPPSGATTSPVRGSAPTPRSASAPRPARWRARNGIATRPTGICRSSARATTTPGSW